MMHGLRVLLAFIYAQEAFGQLGAVEYYLPQRYTDLGSINVLAVERDWSASGVRVQPTARDLQEEDGERRCVTVDLSLTGCDDVDLPAQTVTVWFLPPGSTTDDVSGFLGVVNAETVVFQNGQATATFDEDDIVDSTGAKAGFCEDCVVRAVGSNRDCVGGQMTTSNVMVSVKGDPHMVGLLGQKIDWVGEDNMWYCLLADGPDFQINVRLSAPMKERFPDRQLVSAVSLLTSDGHSLVIEVKDPYSTKIDGCPEKWTAPCLGEGGVRILVDGEEFDFMQRPGDSVRLQGGVVIFAANLLPECRPFGGDRIWAAQFEQMKSGRRALRNTTPITTFTDWILESDSLAAPSWCAKLLDEGGLAGLLSGASNHMTVRIETKTASIRVNVGVNYQDLETGPDGTILVPELEFWQTDLGFDMLQYSDAVTGLLGDTSRFVLDDEGLPVTVGLSAMHAPVESYVVDGPFERVFGKRRL